MSSFWIWKWKKIRQLNPEITFKYDINIFFAETNYKVMFMANLNKKNEWKCYHYMCINLLYHLKLNRTFSKYSNFNYNHINSVLRIQLWIVIWVWFWSTTLSHQLTGNKKQMIFPTISELQEPQPLSYVARKHKHYTCFFSFQNVFCVHLIALYWHKALHKTYLHQ